MRIVIERPADGHFDERRLLAEPKGCPKFRYVTPPRPVRPIVGAHKARIVEKAILEQKIDGVGAQIPRRRAITARRAATEAPDRLVRPLDVGLLLFAALGGGWHMGPAVVG